MKTRDDIIMATGRSDHPNQVNNVLGFPFILRSALDVRATKINEKMKMAAVLALAEITKETVPEFVNIAYDKTKLTFGKKLHQYLNLLTQDLSQKFLLWSLKQQWIQE